MKIAMFLGRNEGSPINARYITSGNPGVGGTQYEFLLLAHYLNISGQHFVKIYANRQYELEQGISFEHAKNEKEFVTAAHKDSYDLIILRGCPDNESRESIAQSSIPVIIWSHNFINAKDAEFIVRTNSIKLNVFVGKQQYDSYIDHPIIEKSAYIPNMYPDTQTETRIQDSRTVVYMGALIERKGFLELCDIWPKVLQYVPDAKLKVIGSGNLYSDGKMGELGIASPAFEAKIRNRLSDNVLLGRVEFLGKMGAEKHKIFSKASVGVLNISGGRETFGMGVLEMASNFCPVVTKATTGYYDTVENGVTGFLCGSKSEVCSRIIYLLLNKDKNEEMGIAAKNYIKEFAPDNVMPLWFCYIEQIKSGSVKPKNLPQSAPFIDNFKWLRITFKFIKNKTHVNIPSLLQFESFVISSISSLRKLISR